MTDTHANAVLLRYRDDSLTYGIVVVTEADGVRRVRQRFHYLAPPRPIFDLMRDYFTSDTRRVEYRVGKLGNERLHTYVAPDGQVLTIREDGVGHVIGWVTPRDRIGA